MVRLKGIMHRRYNRFVSEFQFQSGAVKSFEGGDFMGGVFNFNSKVVRLKAFGAVSLRAVTLISIPKWCG